MLDAAAEAAARAREESGVVEARLRGEKEAAVAELRHELHGCKVAAEVARQQHEALKAEHALELAAAHEQARVRVRVRLRVRLGTAPEVL